MRQIEIKRKIQQGSRNEADRDIDKRTKGDADIG